MYRKFKFLSRMKVELHNDSKCPEDYNVFEGFRFVQEYIQQSTNEARKHLQGLSEYQKPRPYQTSTYFTTRLVLRAHNNSINQHS